MQSNFATAQECFTKFKKYLGEVESVVLVSIQDGRAAHSGIVSGANYSEDSWMPEVFCNETFPNREFTFQLNDRTGQERRGYEMTFDQFVKKAAQKNTMVGDVPVQQWAENAKDAYIGKQVSDADQQLLLQIASKIFL